MKKLFLVLVIIGLVSFGCKKEDYGTSVVKTCVGTIDASYVVKDADVKISKGLTPDQLVNRTWIMYAIHSSFYGNQPYALIKGNECHVVLLILG